MKTSRVRLTFGSTAAGFVISLLVTMLAWNILIERRAFQCTDDVGFGCFLENMDTHRGAGDTVSPGWTWEKIKTIQALHVLAFLAIWLGIAATPTLTLVARAKREFHAHAN